MMLTEENLCILRKTSSTATISTANPTWTVLERLSLHSEKLVTCHLGYCTASMHYMNVRIATLLEQ
jgi:hypothetical protein